MNLPSKRALKLSLSIVVGLSFSSFLYSGASASTTQISDYSFEDYATSNVATDTISANNGAVFGNPAPTSSADVPNTAQTNSASAQFDGQNFFQISNSLGDNFTICAWIKTASFGGGQHWTSAPIVDSESGGWALDFGFGINDQGTLIFGNGGYDSNQGGYDSWVNGTTVVNNSQWHHACASRDNTNGAIKLFVDGALDATGTTGTGILTSNPNIKIGNGSDGNQPFVGLIDDLRLYTSVLTAEEIASIAHPPVPDPGPTPEPTPDPTIQDPMPSSGSLAETGKMPVGISLFAGAAALILLGVGSLVFVNVRSNRKS